MQHYNLPYPPPDVHPSPSPPTSAPAPPTPPDFLIVGLFSLRITKKLVESLHPYLERDADIAWLAHFLALFPPDCDLAKVSGVRKTNYVLVYRDIVARMKRQPHYPARFMEMNPARPDRRDELRRQGGMTDAERLEMIDFSDAALEWGSVVLLPASDMQRMLALADQRRIAGSEPRDTGDADSGYAMS
ncbi:hypothetical protein EKO04_009062 [Ascochyta lentis]|uniref:Uncharacterized protein n=1 Tax=Ascochyta lentis TaxID=205686 RepID=A0A8H7IXQ4_9PLEO|nr:hypothetical protein EKO04_009062 [Ascochyta lentis]